MHKLILALSLVSLMTAFSCKSEKAVSVSLDNPFQDSAFLALTKPPKAAFAKFRVLGSLENQLIPCECFMRPNGGLERIENFFSKNTAAGIPLFSLGGFWNAGLLKDVNAKTKLDLIADFLSKSQFEGILLNRADLDFLRAYYDSVGEKKYESYVSRFSSLPWILPEGMAESDLKLVKNFPKSYSSKTLSDWLVIGLTSSGDVAKVMKGISERATSAKYMLVLGNFDRSELKDYQSMHPRLPTVVVLSTPLFDRPTAMPSGPVMTFLTEERSRSIGELTLWDEPKQDPKSTWVSLEHIQNLNTHWVDAVDNANFKDQSSFEAMQKECETRLKNKDPEIQELSSMLAFLRTQKPNLDKPIYRYDVSAVDLGAEYSGKNRLSDRLKKITPAAPK